MNSFGSSVGLSPSMRTYLDLISAQGPLPPIRGRWYFVDPKSGSDTSSGGLDDPLKNLRAAYDICTTSAGDGICFLSRASATTADTTSYLGGSLLWTKHGITVVGVAAPIGYNCRARIASKDRAYAATTQFSWTAAGVITDTRSGFLTQGFEVGDVIKATAAAGTAITVSNRISAVTASTITLTDAVTVNLTPGVSIISTHCEPLIVVSGRNNSFLNLSFVQSGDTATDLGAVQVTGPDNYFGGCYFNGGGHATPGADTGCYDINVVASELLFEECVFGTNATVHEAANANIMLGSSTTAIGQVEFNRCKVLSAGADITRGGINIINAATLGGWILFRDCVFLNFTSNLRPAVGTKLIIGVAQPTGTGIALHNCGIFGWIAVGASNDAWYCDNAAGAATGGLAATL
jgi:hypothetical protein